MFTFDRRRSCNICDRRRSECMYLNLCCDRPRNTHRGAHLSCYTIQIIGVIMIEPSDRSLQSGIGGSFCGPGCVQPYFLCGW